MVSMLVRTTHSNMDAIYSDMATKVQQVRKVWIKEQWFTVFPRMHLLHVSIYPLAVLYMLVNIS